MIARSTLTAAAAVFLASGAQAQREPETGTRFQRPKAAKIDERSMPETERGRLLMAELARCAVETYPNKTIAALASGRAKPISELATSDCLVSGLAQFSATVWRGALYGELYRREFAAGPPVLMEQTIAFGENMPDFQGNIGILHVADCVIRQDPANVHSFIMQTGRGAREQAAFAALVPLLGPCVPAGQTVTLTKTSLEGAFSEAMYRQAQRSPQATTVGS